MSKLFKSTPKAIKSEWIDYNGHLNMAYYSVLMDQAADDLYPSFGFGESYLAETGCTTYAVEFHISYLRELHLNDLTYCTVQLIGFDTKRFHLYFELFHEDGWLSACGESLGVHVNQSASGGPKSAHMPDYIQSNFAAVLEAQGDLPKPARSGRGIDLTKKPGR